MVKQKARTPPKGIISASDMASRLQMDKRRLRQTVKELFGKREQYLNRWLAIRDYQLPYLGDFTNIDNEDNMADRKDTKIYNTCAWESNQVFAAGVMSGLTPPSRRWFRFNFSNEELSDNSGLGKLLDQRIDIVNDVLEKSNFYTAVHSCYLELAFGQSPLAVFPDSQYGVHFECFPIGSYCIGNGPDGMVNLFCRKYRMSARQLVDKFGQDNVPERIMSELDNGPGIKKTHNVIWLVKPNPAADQNKIGNMYLPFSSIYYLEDSQEDEYLYVGGFYEWPVPVARYLVNGNEAYGKGPGWFCEGDSKALQLMEKDKLTAVELQVKPPMVSTADSNVKGINLVPGGKTFVTQQGGVAPLFQVQTDLNALQAVITELQDRIKRSYNSNLFMMLNEMEDKTMTAREVIERNQEKMTVLGPVVQRMQFEFLGRIIERVYNILDRAQIFPVPEDPDLQQTLADEEIKIEYISPLAQAQKMSGLVNIEQAVAFVGNLAQFNPGVLDKMNWPEAVNRYFDLVGAPAAIKRTDDEFEEIQQQKQEQEAQMAQMQQAAQMAQAAAPAAQAAKNATEAARDGNPALQAIMGMDNLGYGSGG